MAVAHVKSVAAIATATNTVACNLGSAPASGNLLVFMMAGDKNAGALTLAGFTQGFELLSTSVSLYYYWKVSDGSEQTINPSWVTAGAGSDAWYGEYEDVAVAGSTWQVSGSASHITDEVATLTWATGTTGALTADGLAIALACVDSAGSFTAPSWSASYVARHSSAASGSVAGKYNAELAVLSGATTSSTFSASTTADQVSAAVMVFTKVAGGATVPDPTSLRMDWPASHFGPF